MRKTAACAHVNDNFWHSLCLFYLHTCLSLPSYVEFVHEDKESACSSQYLRTTICGMNIPKSVIRKHNLHETRVISERGLEMINTLVCFGTQEPQGGERSNKTKTSRRAAEQVVSTHTDCETVGIQVCIRY